MNRYFKVIEIDADEFINSTGEDLEFSQLVVSENESVFVAIDDEEEYEMEIPLDCFDKSN